MKIPFVDLKAQYSSIKDKIDSAIRMVIEDTAFIKGKYVEQFEDKFSKIYDISNFISCANGTDAIFLVLKALGISKGDEVITVANTWISSSETITMAGAKVVFEDIDRDSYLIDLDKLEEKINKNTKAIIFVHLYGNPINMDKASDICRRNNVYLIEDCAQAHFAEWKGNLIGKFGIAGTFSFFPGKNLGAYGDAGGIITNDNKLAKNIRLLANHGSLDKKNHLIEGLNSRLDGIQASILSVKLDYIHEWTDKRILNAKYYIQQLSSIKEIELPKIRKNTKHVFHLFVIRAVKRDELKIHLETDGIQTGIHYPTPLPFLDAYKYLNHSKNDFPIVYSNQKNILSLPMFPELTFKKIDYIVDSIESFYKKNK